MQGPRPILASASGNDADGSCGIGRVSSNDEEKHPTKKLLRKILIVGDLGCGYVCVLLLVSGLVIDAKLNMVLKA